MENPTKRERLQQLFALIADEIIRDKEKRLAERHGREYTGEEPKGLVTVWINLEEHNEVILIGGYRVEVTDCSNILNIDYNYKSVNGHEIMCNLIIPLQRKESLNCRISREDGCHDVNDDDIFEDEECKEVILQIIKDTFPEKLPEAEALFA